MAQSSDRVILTRLRIVAVVIAGLMFVFLYHIARHYLYLGAMAPR